MSVIVATFGKPEDITNFGTDGKVFRFPAALIDRNDIGTPRQPSKTKSVQIRVTMSDGCIQTWGLGQPNDLIKLVKVMFEFAKEHLTTELILGTWTGGDLAVKSIPTRTKVHVHSILC